MLSDASVVPCDKQPGRQVQHPIGLGSRPGLTHIAGQSLPKQAKEPFDMRTLAAGFAYLLMLGGVPEHRLIRGPEVAEALCRAIRRRDSAPEPSTGPSAPVSNHKRYDLPGAPA
jgi:hypothetical protein